MVEEARLEKLDGGLTPVTEGWFAVHVPEARWVRNEAFGAACIFEGDDAPFREVGFTLAVLQPGQPSGLYHREANQEDFLVLVGEALLLIEGEERILRAWDFVHCPPNTEHILVGAGSGPCVIFMTGARKATGNKRVVYPSSELAIEHGAGVSAKTTSPARAYASLPKWRPGPPTSWSGLPWAGRRRVRRRRGG